MKIVRVTKLNCFGYTIFERELKEKTEGKQLVVVRLTEEGETITANKYDVEKTAELCASTVCDKSGNLYVAYGDGSDIVIMKLCSQGKIVWKKKNIGLNTKKHEKTPKLAIDDSEYIYISYITDNSANGDYDIVVAKIDKNGLLIWLKRNYLFNTHADDTDNVISIDTNGNVYIAYQTITKTNTHTVNIFKLDTNGVFIWLKHEKLPTISPPAIATDPHNNCYIAYSTTSQIIVLIKFDASGNKIWEKQHHSTHHCPTIQVDDRECVYLIYTVPHSHIVITKYCTKICTPEDITTCHNIEYPTIPPPTSLIPHCSPEAHTFNQISRNTTMKKTILYNKLINITQYYTSQIKTIKLMESHTIGIIQHLNKFTTPKQNILLIKDLSQYITSLHPQQQSKKLITDIKNTFYGTTETVTGKPIGYAQGLGGISSCKLSGNITITQNHHPHTFTLCSTDDIAYIANRIKQKFCHNLSVVDGLEVGIHINYCGVLCMSLLSKEYGDVDGYFSVYGNTDHEHTKLTSQIKEQFNSYISYIAYDQSTQIIHIIFKRGFTIQYRQRNSYPNKQFTITTYINNIPINTGTKSTTVFAYIYGYLLVYNCEPNFCIKMPITFLNHEELHPKSITETATYFKQNATLSIGDIFCPKLIATDKVVLKMGDSYEETIDIKTFSSWNGFITTMIRQLETEIDGNQYNAFRVNNVCQTMTGYKNYLHATQKLLVIAYNMMAKSINMFVRSN